MLSRLRDVVVVVKNETNEELRFSELIVGHTIKNTMDENSFSTTYSVSPSSLDELELSMKKLQDAIETIFPTLYYALDKYLERGFIYKCKETKFYPEFVIFHPDDLEDVTEMVKSRRFVNIKNWLATAPRQ